MPSAVTRSSVRQLVERHIRAQMNGHVSGRWHAVQNDNNDELNEIASEIGRRCDQAEAERFLRLYAEEVLAIERDMRASPIAATHSLFGDGGRDADPSTPGLLLIEHKRRPATVVLWVLVVAVIGGLMVVRYQ